MRLQSLWWTCLAASLGQSATALVRPRQLSGLVEKQNFLRRAFHATAVLHNRLYIDGGDFSYLLSPKGSQYDYSNALLRIDLDKDFTSDEGATITAIAKPNTVPSLLHGGLWIDDKRKQLYVGFAGVHSQFFGDHMPQPHGLYSFSPDMEEGKQWRNMNDSAPHFTQWWRPFFGSAASGNGKGYYLGGSTGDSLDSHTPTTGMLVHDFDSLLGGNQSVVNVTSRGIRQTGSLHFIPHFGANGILLALGGSQGAGLRTLPAMQPFFSLSSIEIYDIATKQWYEQQTTGGPPSPRREFCVTGAASAQGTYELFLYAGWADQFGKASIPLDEAWILTVPGFHWVKAEYPPLHPREGHTCEHARGGQILVVGGLDPTREEPARSYQATFDSPDNFPQGIGLFDMENMTFVTKYKSRKRVYNSNWGVQDYYDKNPGLSHMASNLTEVFRITNFTSTVDTTTNDTSIPTSTPNPTNTPISTPASANNAAAIAGGVVGGVAALSIIATGYWLLIRTWRRKHMQRSELGAAVSEMDAKRATQASSQIASEMSGDYGAHELASPETVTHEMWAEPYVRPTEPHARPAEPRGRPASGGNIGGV